MGKGKRLERKRRQEFRRALGKLGCLIYVVTDENDNIRYCGQTRCQPDKKVGWLLKGAQKNPNTPFHRWLLAQESAKLKWRVQVVDHDGRWDVSEILWIERLRNAGHPILNVLRGGNDSIQCAVTGLNPNRKTTLQRLLPAQFALEDIMQREHMAAIMFER